MCRMSTLRTTRLLMFGLASLALTRELAVAQSPSWRKLGNDAVGLNLAGPAGGPVTAVWFSPAGDRLYARISSGQVLETTDYSKWTVARNPSPAPEQPISPGQDSRGARVQSSGGRQFALGRHLEVSDDDGRTWINLTAYNDVSIIGPHQRALAVSPLDPRQIVVANDYGVWRSADGGLSWSGLNEDLPNLPIRRLLPPTASGVLRAEVEGLGIAELPPAAAASQANWILSQSQTDAGTGSDTLPLRRAASVALGTGITALATSSSTWYAGSGDGRLWTSSDSGANWQLSPQRGYGAIEGITVIAEAPHSALAISAGSTGARLLRTTNDGSYWDDLSANLPEGVAHGLALDAPANVAYLATDRGLFTARVDLNNPGPSPNWGRIGGLPDGRVMDVRFDRVRNQLYVAVDGYGLYVAPAPHRGASVRVLNAADQTAQTAAPGVLLHVQGNGLTNVALDGGAPGGSALALVSRSEASAQVQVPFEASGSSLPLLIESSLGQSRMALPLRSAAPSILLDSDGLPIMVDAGSGLTLDAQNMARPGSRIQIFAAGLGKVYPDWRAGVPAPEDAPAVVARVDALLDGVPLEVTRATLAPAYVGLYLVEVQLPGLVNAGTADFSLSVNGETSNHVRILLGSER